MSVPALSHSEAHAWREDGCFCRESVFFPEEVEILRAAVERCVARVEAEVAVASQAYRIDGNRYFDTSDATVQLEHDPASQCVRVVEPFHHLDARCDALVDDPRIVVPMRELVEDDQVSLFTDKINLKRPYQGSAFRWHQDSPYWAHFASELDRLPNVLLTLDDATADNGCFRVIAGSHKRGMLPGREGEGVLGPLFTHPDAFDLSRQRLFEVPAGSLVFFSPHSVHGSEPNRSGTLRRAAVLTYQPGGRRMFKRDARRDAGAAYQVPEGS